MSTVDLSHDSLQQAISHRTVIFQGENTTFGILTTADCSPTRPRQSSSLEKSATTTFSPSMEPPHTFGQLTTRPAPDGAACAPRTAHQLPSISNPWTHRNRRHVRRLGQSSRPSHTRTSFPHPSLCVDVGRPPRMSSTASCVWRELASAPSTLSCFSGRRRYVSCPSQERGQDEVQCDNLQPRLG